VKVSATKHAHLTDLAASLALAVERRSSLLANTPGENGPRMVALCGRNDEIRVYAKAILATLDLPEIETETA
jgi:hypothetical protein